MAICDKVNINASSTHEKLGESEKKTRQEHAWTLKETLKSNKTNPIDGGPAPYIIKGNIISEICRN